MKLIVTVLMTFLVAGCGGNGSSGACGADCNMKSDCSSVGASLTAVQALADGRELGWDWDRVNVNGGAVALGHPIGASGARVLTTLLYALRDRGRSTGLATLCLGGGNAVALSVELL